MNESEKLDALREALDAGIRSLDRGEGRELIIEERLELARARWAASLKIRDSLTKTEAAESS